MYLWPQPVCDFRRTGSGKTTLLEELQRRGFQCAPEVARQIIQEQVQTGGTALPWKDREAYTWLMLQRSIESYESLTTANAPVFLDRGIPDSLCYARLIGLADETALQDACRRYRYASVVFLTPPWAEIYSTDNERKQDFDEAQQTYRQMADVYRECGYQLLEVPKATPSVRAQFVLDELRLP